MLALPKGNRGIGAEELGALPEAVERRDDGAWKQVLHDLLDVVVVAERRRRRGIAQVLQPPRPAKTQQKNRWTIRKNKLTQSLIYPKFQTAMLQYSTECSKQNWHMSLLMWK